jgi:hypothetical protein
MAVTGISYSQSANDGFDPNANGSGSLFESVRMFYLKATPPMVDFDGDGKTDIAVYRSSTGAWFVIPSSTGTSYGAGFGGDPSDIPVTTNPVSIC